MSNVLVEKNKLDVLANAISNKSGEPLTLTLDEMVEAVDGIETGGGGITPTGNIDITHAGQTDVTNYATATVPSAEMYEYDYLGTYSTVGGTRRWTVGFEGSYGNGGWIQGIVEADGKRYSAVPSGTTITPTESAQTIGGANTMMEGAVTVSAIPSNYVGSGITQRSSTDLTVSGDTVTAPSGYYTAQASKSVASGTAGTPTATKGTVSNHSVSVTPSVTNTTGYITGSTITGTAVSVTASELVSGTLNVTSSGTKDVTNYASASIPSGTEGTPTATKGAVSNHSVSVTPSVTNTTGYITGSTKTGTAVTVSASELVSGSETKTANGTYDVTNLAELVVNVSGGGGGGLQIDTISLQSSQTTSSLTYTGLKGEPTSFAIMVDDSITPSAQPTVAAVVFDGTSLHGQTITNTTNAQVSYDGSSFSKSYSNGTLTITSSGASFKTVEYFLVYSYGGGSVDTKDAQVGSGATTITFTGLEDEPAYWSCIFKSNFGTSSGYQRVIYVGNNGVNTTGIAMDSSTHNSNSYWTASYSNGSFTISSQGTNAGGYFHQPGYYQLTYAYDDGSGGNYQTKNKTYTPTTSQQTETIQADAGYDALKKVNVTVNAIPSEYIIPTGNINITSNTASGQTLNVSQYATATVNVPTSGTSKNVQVLQSTSRTNSSSLTKVLGDLTVSKTGTYDVYWSGGRSNTSTSYTWGTRLYIDGTGYGTENTSWSNNCQSNHLSNVSLTANQKLSVYARGRTGSYYTFAPMLTIIEA